MPTPLTPSSSQEIIPISPPPAQLLKRARTITSVANLDREINNNKTTASPSYSNKGKGRASDVGVGGAAGTCSSEAIEVGDEPDENEAKYDASAATTLPRGLAFSPSIELKDRAYRARDAYTKKEEIQTGKRKLRRDEVKRAGREVDSGNREQVTSRMMSTLGKDSNPITNSDLYTRADHFVSAATGHQVSNRGGGSSGAKTYWEVRTAKMEDQARGKVSDLLKGLVFYINGSTGPRASNLQVQHLITANGGRFVPMQSASCTHILTTNLSGSKTQKWINGQAGRGCAKRTKVVRIDWLLDSVEKGIKLSEAGYDVIVNPSQQTLFSSLGVLPKSQLPPPPPQAHP